MHERFSKLKFAVVYMDDIAFVSKKMGENVVHLRVVFEMPYLGHVVNRDGIAVDPKKIRAIEKCPTPTSRKKLQSWLGLFAEMVLPLGEITKEKVAWSWAFVARSQAAGHSSEVLASRKALSKPRNQVMMEGVRAYFYDLASATLGFKCGAANVYNMDETSFMTKGDTRSTQPNQTYHMTIVAEVAADGFAAPPAFILPSLSVETVVLDSCPVPGYILVHPLWSMETYFTCDETAAITMAYGIKIIRLPPNATHLLQPLDMAVFLERQRVVACAAIEIAGTAYNEMMTPKA
ncbi:hypothetical protein ACHHYP_20545 [Achlya hypogyna]|uniref:Reverse transcriptase domain-containing protein n=1 Tax=Achlya hypogyna TaxID=1202772 RepID=A0A1V9YJC3_ACHHY|nr:hypothetical protein ACHHYP_20545 [Achlya hypogyna]